MKIQDLLGEMDARALDHGFADQLCAMYEEDRETGEFGITGFTMRPCVHSIADTGRVFLWLTMRSLLPAWRKGENFLQQRTTWDLQTRWSLFEKNGHQGRFFIR